MKFIQDMKAIKHRDPACRNYFEVVLLYSGFHALLFYRAAHMFYKAGCFFIARLLSQLGRLLTGVEIHPGATIGSGLLIDHGSGVVIGETAEIGDNCTIYQGVTLGGTGKDTGKRHPTLGNDVLIGAGAKVLGPVTIGNHAKVAAGAVVLNDLPDHATAVGVPARVVRIAGRKADVCDEMDQIHIPDPIAQELCYMTAQIERLKAQVKALESVSRGTNPDKSE